jgi:hypothetical protein
LFPVKFKRSIIEVKKEIVQQAREAPQAEIAEPAAVSIAASSDEKVEKPPVRQIEPRGATEIVQSVFLTALIMIACLWLLLIYVDDTSGQGVGVWFAWIGYMVLGFFWFGFLAGRFKDAGFSDAGLTLYLIFVSGASLTPLVNHWVSGYWALAIFVLVQIPIVFLRSKPRPDEPLPESGTHNENEDCLRDPWEGMRASHKGEPEITYQRPKRGFLKDRGLGVANWSPRKRQY